MKRPNNKKENEHPKSDKKRSVQYGCMNCEEDIEVYKDDLCDICWHWYQSTKPYCT